MPYLSLKKIEGIAKRIFAAYSKLPEVDGSVIERVDPMLLAERLLGLTVKYHYLTKSGAMLGVTAFGPVGIRIYDSDCKGYCFMDGKTILLDTRLIHESANVGRHNFTLAHEACHQVYKMMFPKEYRDEEQLHRLHFCADPPVYDDYWEEWRTNALAAAVLMPETLVRKNMCSFGLGEKIRLLNKVFAPQEYEKYCAVADCMGVSKQALAIRMNQLGLLEKDYLKNPYDLVSIYKDEDD